MALKYYASVRIDVRKSKIIEGKVEGGPAIGLKIKAKVVKNKVGPPAGVTTFDLLFAKGIDQTSSLLDAADVTNVVSKRGAWYYYNMEGEEVALGQGRDKAVMFLNAEENAKERQALEAATRERLQSGGLPGGLIAEPDSSDEESAA
jgi:recombination protein RecA